MNNRNEYLDDITYIKELRHTNEGIWHFYDVLFDFRGYGWDYMVQSADYMAKADLKNISQLTIGDFNSEFDDLTKSYYEHDEQCANMPELAEERGSFSMAGISKALGAPMKIVWINQSRVMRFFTTIDNETLIRQYVETVVRRTFNTELAMKTGKPIPDNL